MGWEPGQIHTPRFAGSRELQPAASEKMVTCNQPKNRETRRHVMAMLYMNLCCSRPVDVPIWHTDSIQSACKPHCKISVSLFVMVSERRGQDQKSIHIIAIAIRKKKIINHNRLAIWENPPMGRNYCRRDSRSPDDAIGDNPIPDRDLPLLG